MGQKAFMQPKGLVNPGTYSQVVTAKGGTLVFIAGQVAQDANGQIIGEGDLLAQARQVYENLKIALAASGATFDDVVKLNTYIVNYKTADRAVLLDVRNQFVSKTNPPASTLIGVQALARPEFLIEIEAIAVV